MKNRIFNLLICTKICALLLFSIGACNQETTNENSTKVTQESFEAVPAKLAVEKPFKTLNQQSEKISLADVSQPQVYTLNSGTVINVPANTFEDLDGNQVEGEVQLEFREINSAAEIIASGIPMHFIDDNGETQWMQSAGMFEVEGFQNGKPVRIAEGKGIDISYASEVEGDYDFWSFDEEKGNWKNEGATESKPALTLEADPAAIQQEIKALKRKTSVPPTKPVFEEANKLVFNDLDVSNCPALKGQNPVVLMYSGNDNAKAPKKNKWIRKPGIWHKKIIKPVGNGEYELTMLGDKMYQIKVKEAPTALEVDKENEAYQQKLAAFRANTKLLAQKVAKLSDRAAMQKQQNRFLRMARISGFGIHNYDRLWKRKDAVSLLADFEIDGIHDAAKNLIGIYLITDDDKTVVKLPRNIWKKFRFSPSAQNKVLAVLPDNEVALFDNDDFEEERDDMIAASGSDYTFNMGNDRETIDSMNDLDEILNGESRELRDVKYYPNPANAHVTIALEEPIDRMQLLNMHGQIVTEKSDLPEGKTEINVSNYPPGNYLLRFEKGRSAKTEKLIIGTR